MPTNRRLARNCLAGTKTCQYFLDQFGVATMDAAVESAVAEMLPPSLQGMGGQYKLPVDVMVIARRRGVEVREDLPLSPRKEADLVAGPDRFVVRLRPDATTTRKRLSLAHELGHTLFFRDFVHQIASLDAREIAAEEEICWRFATTLLMPSFALKRLLSPVPATSPWGVIGALEQGARHVQVSLAGLLARLRHVRPPLGSYLFVCSRFSENRQTRIDPQLRVESSCGLGDLHNCWVWTNRSVDGLQMYGARHLFDAWQTNASAARELSRGRFVWDAESGLRSCKPDTLSWQTESIEVSVLDNDRWRTRRLPFRTAHCLYAWGVNVREAYVLSVLAPPPDAD